MADPRIEKVFHDAGNDVGDLKRDFSFEFESVFDTQVAAQFCGRKFLGLETLLEAELGVPLFKVRDIQRCDWSRRPLTPAHERYAAEDVLHLLALRDRFRAELRAIGRESWAAEECREICRMPPSEPRQPGDCLKMKGTKHFTRRELAVLRELLEFREDLARRQDAAPFRVFSDMGLLALASQRPRDRAALAPIRGVPASFRNHRAAELLAVIRRGEAVPDDRLPLRPRPERVRLGRGIVMRMGRLKAWRHKAAEKVKLDPGFVLPQRLIGPIAAGNPATVEALAAIPGVQRWRVEAFGPEILAVLKD
jgi:ribonuclease D